MLYVKVIDGEVKEVWDTQPPENDPGWREAVEIRPEINPLRQYYNGHTFDLSKNPVEIVYGVENVSLEARKYSMKSIAKSKFQDALFKEANRQTRLDDPIDFDVNLLENEKLAMDSKIFLINNASSHEDLDGISV